MGEEKAVSQGLSVYLGNNFLFINIERSAFGQFIEQFKQVIAAAGPEVGVEDLVDAALFDQYIHD